VLVQAYAIEHPAIVHAARHDFDGFARVELEQRAALANPPFGHLALVRVHGPDAARVEARAEALGRFLREGIATLGQATGEDAVQVLGPVPSPIARINRRARYQLLLRGRARGPLRYILEHLRERLGLDGTGATQTTALVDVDPQSLL
jgi:primosomal protein N' (replication factor Y)